MIIRKPEGEVTAPCLPSEQAEEIRTQLERVLSSQLFRGSRRCQNLLRHIIEQTLVGDTIGLKERTLGVGVFGRTPDYDTAQDPVVRATAAEIRKKLAQYYQQPDHESEPRIDLLAGSYVPGFHFNGHVNGHVNGHAKPTSDGHRRPYWVIGAAAAAILTAAVALVVMLPLWRASVVEQFWAPVLQSPGSVLICLGQPVVYNLVSAQAQDNIQASEALAQSGSSQPAAIPRKDLIILWDRYVALGDAMSLVRLTSMFDKYRKPYRIRGERSTTSVDLRENAAVLIAAFDNQWTLRAEGQLRFTFAKDSPHDTDMVRDKKHPENTAWKLTGAWPHWDVPNDYAIISRIHDVNTDRPVVIAAGITQYGTMAAGEFLSNPEYLAEAVPLLPRGWQKKNLQIVLRVPVVRGASGHPRVLATHVW